MKIIKKFTAIKVNSRPDQEAKKVDVNLSYGDIRGDWYSNTYMDTEFDTEEEAVEAAFKEDKYANWLILPIISFDFINE